MGLAATGCMEGIEFAGVLMASFLSEIIEWTSAHQKMRVLCGWKENSSNFSTRVENKNIWINKMEVRNEGTMEYEANQKKN